MGYIIAIVVTAVICLPLGAWLHYLYGSSVKSAIASIETDIKKMKP